MAVNITGVEEMTETRTPKQEDGSRRELRKVQEVIRLFQQENPNMPAQVMNVFFAVALNEGKSMRELMAIAGVDSQSTMSRHLLDLGERNRRKEPGYQLVKAELDPMELRKKQYTLTKKGRWMIDRVLHTIQEQDY